MRRVSSIAVVHETLSGTLDEAMSFDEVADRVLAMVAEVTGQPVAVRRSGRFGVLPAEVATPLAMVLSELVQNAVEHGYAQGRRQVEVHGRRRRTTAAAGRGGRRRAGAAGGVRLAGSDRLGLQIVRTLVESELGGRLTLEPAAGRRHGRRGRRGDSASEASRACTWVQTTVPAAVGRSSMTSARDHATADQQREQEPQTTRNRQSPARWLASSSATIGGPDVVLGRASRAEPYGLA